MSGLMVLLELGEGSLVLQLGTKEGEYSYHGASVSPGALYGFMLCNQTRTHGWGQEDFFGWSRIPFRAVLLLPGSEQESPLIIDNNSTWQLLCTSCG